MEHHPTQQVSIETFTGTSEGVRVIRLRGPLTIHNFFEFQELCRQQPHPRVLLIDLTEVPYIDSAALGSLIGVHVSCDKDGRKYALINVNERVKRLFVMSRVDSFLVTYESVSDAEAAFSS